jgi:hypothetical protein
MAKMYLFCEIAITFLLFVKELFELQNYCLIFY